MNHKGTQRIETERLILRAHTLDDAEAMYNNWASDPEVTKYLTWPVHESAEASRALLEEWVPQYENDNYYQWTIVLKEEGDEPIGGISVVGSDDVVEKVHIGYCIGKKWWRQGITSEALAALINFFFEKSGVNEITSRHDVNNPNSGKVMMK